MSFLIKASNSSESASVTHESSRFSDKWCFEAVSAFLGLKILFLARVTIGCIFCGGGMAGGGEVEPVGAPGKDPHDGDGVCVPRECEEYDGGDMSCVGKGEGLAGVGGMGVAAGGCRVGMYWCSDWLMTLLVTV